MNSPPPALGMTSIEYGVRRSGGNVEVAVSMHVAVLEVARLIAAGEKNVWLVRRRVEDWRRA